MNKLKKFTYKSDPGDLLNQIFLFILSVIQIVFHSGIEYWYVYITLNLVLIFLISVFVNFYEDTVIKNSSHNFLKIIRYWYSVPVILFCFKQVYYIIYSLKIPDCDLALIKIDYFIFSVNPTEWFYRFEHPLLTEFLQIIYFLYYILIIVYGLEVYLLKKFDEFKQSVFFILLGFYICYIFYMIFPAIGPRFYLHDFSSISSEMPGLFLAEPLRKFLDFGESIPSNVINPQEFAQRDAMPSAHTTLAIIIAYLSGKFKLKSFYFYLIYCILMIISTIYLRYHYVIDLAAGALVALLAIYISNKIFNKKVT